MAVNPIQFLVAQNASITDGTKTITISGNVDCSRVYSGTAIFLGGADNPAEAVSGTSPDGSGNSTITLRNSWSQGDIVNQQLVSFNTNEGLAEAISNVREIVSNVSAIEDLATQGLIKRINDNEYEVVSISALGEALVGASDASSARTALGLGSAATKEVAIDSLLGETTKLMYVGHAGIGALGHSIPDWNTEVKAGFWAGTGGGSVNYPSPFSSFYGWVEMNRASNQDNRARLQVFNEADGTLRVPLASTDDKGTTWYTDELVTKSSMTGWGNIDVSPYPNSNLNDLSNTISGLYGGFGSVSTSNNFPITDSSCNFIIKVTFERSGSCEQIVHFTRRNSVRVNETYIRNSYNNSWLPWVKSIDSFSDFNYYALKDYGEYYPSTANRDIDGVASGDIGLYATGNQGTFPLNTDIGFYHIQTQQNYTGQSKSQFATGYFGTNASNNTPTYSMRSLDNSGQGWTPWVNFLHTGNTNFNEFGGIVDNDLIGLIIATSSNQARMYLPIASMTGASSLTITGAFQIVTSAGTVVMSNVPSSSLEFNAASSERCVRVVLTGLTGLSNNQWYELRTVGSSSKITVNF